jgi:competence protein ComEA
LSRFVRLVSVCALIAPFAPAALAELPDGAGKALTIRLCGKCHSPEQATSLRQDRDDWTDTITKMVSMGAQGSDEELSEVLDYLSKNFGPEAPPPLNVNKATAVDLESSLVLTKSEAAAIIQYRSSKGAFKSIEDFRNVPGLDFKKIEAKKSRITF